MKKNVDDVVVDDIFIVEMQIYSLTSSYIPEQDKHSAANLFNYRVARLRR